MRVLSFTSFAAVAGATWLVVMAACSSDTPQAGIGDGCLINTDCTTPLVCAFRKCHVACITSRDCSPGQRCMASDRPFHVCQLADEVSCSYNSDCPPGQACGTDRQCRDQCAADRDCLKYQVCLGATCADTSEVVDGGLVSEAGPSEDAGVASGLPCNYTSECPASLVCRDGLCTSECLTTLDCQAGYSCANNQCVPGSGTLVGADGGKVTDSSGKLELDVPKGALRSQVAIGIHALEAWPEGALGPVFQIEPSGINFAVPATLTYTYVPADIGTTAPADLRLGFATGSSWTAITSTVDQAAHKVAAAIPHLSTYGLLGPTIGGDAGMVPAGDAGLAECTPVSLLGEWAPSTDANTSNEVVNIPMTTDQSVTYTFSSPGPQSCGCNAQHLVIRLHKTFSCASTRLVFTYATAFVSNALESPAMQIRFSTGDPTSEGPFASNNMFAGSVWNGSSNCAFVYGWNNKFPSTPAIKNGTPTQIDLSPSDTAHWGECNGSFDTVDVHLEYYGCGGSGTATVSNMSLCTAAPPATL